MMVPLTSVKLPSIEMLEHPEPRNSEPVVRGCRCSSLIPERLDLQALNPKTAETSAEGAH